MFARWWQPLFWMIVAIAAAGALVLERRHPPRLPAPAVAQAPDAVVIPPLQPFKPQPLPRYAEIVERPVFIEARRPENDELAAPPAPPPNPDRTLNLIGIVLVPNAAAALLRPEEPNAKVLRVPQGGTIDGWQLETVQAGKVVLRKGGEVRELALIRPSSPPRPVPPATAVSRRAGAAGAAAPSARPAPRP
ncbi:MAG: hypothetical protein WAW42_14715 [Candidatus Competibacteraceae bacterium]